MVALLIGIALNPLARRPWFAAGLDFCLKAILRWAVALLGNDFRSSRIYDVDAATGAASFAGNLLLGGVAGMAVDAASGAALEHKPNPVIVTMRPRGAGAPSPAPRRAKPPRRAPGEEVPQS